MNDLMPGTRIEHGRVFPTRDITNYCVRTKSAPLSATGCHEVVATFQYKHDAVDFAKGKFGSRWEREYEILKYDEITGGIEQ